MYPNPVVVITSNFFLDLLFSFLFEFVIALAIYALLCAYIEPHTTAERSWKKDLTRFERVLLFIIVFLLVYVVANGIASLYLQY